MWPPGSSGPEQAGDLGLDLGGRGEGGSAWSRRFGKRSGAGEACLQR